MRTALIKRKTKETEISIALNIDGRGNSKINTGIRFLDHMLELVAKHGLFDIKLSAKGDLDVDQHHTVEDIGIALGMAFEKALGNKKGIMRAGYFVFPMDESLAIVAVDISGRPYIKFDADFSVSKIGDLEAAVIEDFFTAFANNLKCSLHIVLPYGRNPHHEAEAIFKAFAKAMMVACTIGRVKKLPTTKGRI
ncbi:MAG TPA: imidazoleglycerol-phosphate dehydratase HisB [Candidatus Nanoarchaeia archaeon]|nr:imidazoleglycerol-phosphate dehydratase HisB [Candidatus Nanoarchaeia archaeon]